MSNPIRNPFTLEFLMEHVRADGECLVWTGATTSAGYGTVRFNRTQWRAHRAVYTIVHGPIPSGLLVCHTCDNPPCVAPEHLFLGTNADNMRDKIVKGRLRVARGEDSGGAVLTEEQVRRIRDDHRPSPVVARDYGVTAGAIRGIWAYRTWKHVR
jgi:hypothetical protein